MLESDGIDLQAKKNKKVRKMLDSPEGLNLRNEKKSRSVGGSVQEYIMSLLSAMGAAA